MMDGCPRKRTRPAPRKWESACNFCQDGLTCDMPQHRVFHVAFLQKEKAEQYFSFERSRIILWSSEPLLKKVGAGSKVCPFFWFDISMD
jgi:hypothetical protein